MWAGLGVRGAIAEDGGQASAPPLLRVAATPSQDVAASPRHSHWREAINIVMESGAKELVLFHHDPDHSDECIDKGSFPV